MRAFQGDDAYSFVSDGQAGYLVYALTSAALNASVNGAIVWQSNADEPDLIDYDTKCKNDNVDNMDRHTRLKFRAAEIREASINATVGRHYYLQETGTHGSLRPPTCYATMLASGHLSAKIPDAVMSAERRAAPQS